MVKSTWLTEQMRKYKKKPQFKTGSINKEEKATSGDAFFEINKIWRMIQMKRLRVELQKYTEIAPGHLIYQTRLEQ